MNGKTPRDESDIFLNAKGQIVWRHPGRGPVERRRAQKLAFLRGVRDCYQAVKPPKTEGGHHYHRFAPDGFKWDPQEWQKETGIPLPLSLEEVASECERWHYCPAREIVEAAFTMDAALMALRNFLIGQKEQAPADSPPAGGQGAESTPAGKGGQEKPKTTADDKARQLIIAALVKFRKEGRYKIKDPKPETVRGEVKLGEQRVRHILRALQTENLYSGYDKPLPLNLRKPAVIDVGPDRTESPRTIPFPKRT